MRKSKILAKITSKFSKLLMAFVAAFILFGSAAPALADPGALGQAESSSAASTSGSGVCHPEANGGQPLTADQLSSCEACNKAGQSIDATTKTCLKQNVIVKDLNLIVNVLAGLVSIVSIGVIILGGIQYSTAGGNPQALTNARKRILNGLLALAAFIFIWAFLQWLIPGGV